MEVIRLVVEAVSWVKMQDIKKRNNDTSFLAKPDQW
jgi:hypothetical protein